MKVRGRGQSRKKFYHSDEKNETKTPRSDRNNGTRGVLDTTDHLVLKCDKDDRRPIVERKREFSEVSEFRGVEQGLHSNDWLSKSVSLQTGASQSSEVV